MASRGKNSDLEHAFTVLCQLALFAHKHTKKQMNQYLESAGEIKSQYPFYRKLVAEVVKRVAQDWDGSYQDEFSPVANQRLVAAAFVLANQHPAVRDTLRRVTTKANASDNSSETSLRIQLIRLDLDAQQIFETSQWTETAGLFFFDRQVFEYHPSVAQNPVPRVKQVTSLASIFRTDKYLGKGTYGSVFSGTEFSTGQECVAKIFQEMNDNELTHVLEEMKFMSLIKTHLHTSGCPVHFACPRDIYQDMSTGQYVLLMDMAEGQPLNEWFQQYMLPIPVPMKKPWMETFSSVFYQIFQALDILHQVKLLHHDINFGNILVSDSGLVTLIDFGGMCLISDCQFFVPTTFYAPEQQVREYGDFSVPIDKLDLFGVGGMLYHLLNQSSPFENLPNYVNGRVSATAFPLQNPLAWKPAHPCESKELPQFAQLTNQLLQANPANRPSARQCLEIMDSWTVVVRKIQIQKGQYLYTATGTEWLVENPAQMLALMYHAKQPGYLRLVQVNETLILPLYQSTTAPRRSTAQELAWQDDSKQFSFQLSPNHLRMIAAWPTDPQGRIMQTMTNAKGRMLPLIATSGNDKELDAKSQTIELVHQVPNAVLPIFSAWRIGETYGTWIDRQVSEHRQWVQSIIKIQAAVRGRRQRRQQRHQNVLDQVIRDLSTWNPW